jgi:hypothetical protein
MLHWPGGGSERMAPARGMAGRGPVGGSGRGDGVDEVPRYGLATSAGLKGHGRTLAMRA